MQRVPFAFFSFFSSGEPTPYIRGLGRDARVPGMIWPITMRLKSYLRSRIFGTALAAAAILWVPPVVSAGSIVTYVLGGISSPVTSVPGTTTAPNVVPAPIARNAALTGAAGNEGYWSQGWNNSTAAVTLGFTVTGGVVDVSEFKFGSRSTATGPGSVDVVFAVDGGPFVKEATILQPPPSTTNPAFGGYVDTDLTFATPIVVAHNLNIEFIVTPGALAANLGTIDSAGTWALKDFNPKFPSATVPAGPDQRDRA